MITWTLRPTKTGRPQYRVVCHSCHTVRKLPLSTLVINWLDDHPDETLTAHDIVIKWGCSTNAARGVLRRGREAGKLRGVRQRNTWEWFTAKVPDVR